MTAVRALLERYGRLPLWLRVAAALMWAAFVWWLTATPGKDLPDLPESSFLRNGGHVALFAVLSGLLFLAWPDSLTRRLPWSAGLATLFGIVEEVHQASVPGRDSSYADMLSNGLGALLGVCVLLWILAGDRRALRALPWIAILALASVSLATWAGW